MCKVNVYETLIFCQSDLHLINVIMESLTFTFSKWGLVCILVIYHLADMPIFARIAGFACCQIPFLISNSSEYQQSLTRSVMNYIPATLAGWRQGGISRTPRRPCANLPQDIRPLVWVSLIALLIVRVRVVSRRGGGSCRCSDSAGLRASAGLLRPPPPTHTEVSQAGVRPVRADVWGGEARTCGMPVDALIGDMTGFAGLQFGFHRTI